MTLQQYLDKYGSRIAQDSERLFLIDFLHPILQENIRYVTPQHPFLDSSGKSRRIDFAIEYEGVKLALEVNGETYHAEGVIPNEQFDANLFRQNEMVKNGWFLLRFSFNQLQDPHWRPFVRDAIMDALAQFTPNLIGSSAIQPNPLQKRALERIRYFRDGIGWRKGVVVLPTGTGKTYLSSFDARSHGGRILFIVHRLDILKQSMTAFQRIWPEAKLGVLTGEVRENVSDAQVLFASKDSLRQADILTSFDPIEFDYVIVDEVHHGQSPTYKAILEYLRPRFMLGMTATPDRMDRKDIFELFDYNLIFEFGINDAIEQGYLVPFTYYGLHDDIDYRRVRHNGRRYNAQDLERALLIPKRNEAIFKEYLDKGQEDKCIGFCVSIEHAERMADFFQRRGIPSVAITSSTPNRDELIRQFRENQFSVAFTVDLFNEGMDFPNVRVLMFLRPTESKTIFLQQLGRGLRLCSGKDRVVVLDFIGNYVRANQVRKYLARKIEGEGAGKRGPKPVYSYAPGCEVRFEAEVEEILNRQDEEQRGITKDDLIHAYYELSELLKRKPTQEDLNSQGTYRVRHYLSHFGSWVSFLREIGEYTEASYHYPQGVHLGHILYMLRVLASGERGGTLLDDAYVKLRGGLDQGRIGHIQRQTKYKLQAMMELGLIPDDREFGPDQTYKLELTARGMQLYHALREVLDSVDLTIETADEDDAPGSWRMQLPPEEFNGAIWKSLEKNEESRNLVRIIFLRMPAVDQMANYLYRVERRASISKADIYKHFFASPEVSEYCDQSGIEAATEEGARHRCPFLINVLEAIGLVTQTRTDVTVEVFLASPTTIRLGRGESDLLLQSRIDDIEKAWPVGSATIPANELSRLREIFGSRFLTKTYHLTRLETLETTTE